MNEAYSCRSLFVEPHAVGVEDVQMGGIAGEGELAAGLDVTRSPVFDGQRLAITKLAIEELCAAEIFVEINPSPQHVILRPRDDAQMLRPRAEGYPQFQAFFRDRKPPTLIVWGKNDKIFPEEGAHPYLRDLPDAEMHILDTGHFALEDKLDEMAPLIHDFLDRKVAK